MKVIWLDLLFPSDFHFSPPSDPHKYNWKILKIKQKS